LTKPSTVIGLNHIGLSVSDLEASVSLSTEGASVEVDQSRILGNSAAEMASGFSSSETCLSYRGSNRRQGLDCQSDNPYQEGITQTKVA
tara:strand:- start:11643 stop:11909 length:267 start_codon:yes stop_codon:yes gene_type:complete